MEDSSPFAKLYNTNSAPTDQEAEDLKVLIRAEQAYVDNINKEIQTLVERRDAHARILERHRAILSPTRRVPSDILLSIFEYVCLKGVLKARVQCPSLGTSDMGTPSVVLSHVCQQWRRLSLNHPILWSEIRFISSPYPSPPPESNNPASLEDFSEKLVWYERQVQNMITRHRVYVSRSNPFPLTIALNASDRFTDPDLEGVPCINTVIVDLLCSVSTRWKCVDLYLVMSRGDSPLFRLLNLSKHDVPLLELLELDIGVRRPPSFSGDLEPLPGIPGTELLQAPRLRSLNLKRFPSRIQYNTAVNWKTVTDLCIEDFILSPLGTLIDPHTAIQHAFEILTSFPNLVRCSFALKYSPNIDAATFPHQSPLISLPHLTSLTIRGSPLPRGLASSLNLPSLRTLAILPSGQPEDVTTSEAVDWIRRFGQQLVELTFNYRCMTQSGLLYCLENLPNLNTLRIFGTDSPYRGYPFAQTGPIDSDDRSVLDNAIISDSVLERLTPAFHSGGSHSETVDLPLPLCPKLKKVSLWPAAMEFTEKAFLKFVAARRRRHLRTPFSNPAVSLLETAIVCFNSGRRRDLREVLEEDDSLDLEEFVLAVQARHTGPRRAGSLMTFAQNDQFGELIVEENRLMRN